MNRFWQLAEIAPAPGGFTVTLDGKPMKLPDGLRLAVPQRALAEALAAEWQQAGGGPGGDMRYEDVPLTRLAGTVQHRIAPAQAENAAALAQYAAHDLLCYRAAHPQALSVRQHHAWQPWLDWAATRFGARLAVTHGLMPADQPAAALAALADAAAALNPWVLGALGIIVPALGSLVLGLAVAEAQLSAAEALHLAQLDERFQEEQWGTDEDAATRRAAIARDVEMAGRFLALVRK